MGQWKKNAAIFLLLAALWCPAEEWSQPILKENRNLGVVKCNPYCFAGFLNPGEHPGNFVFDDFKALPRISEQGEKTLDESEALNRFFMRPACRSYSTGEDGHLLRENGSWLLTPIDGGAKASCVFGVAKELEAEISGALVPDKAVLMVTGQFTNRSSQPLQIIFEPQFAALLKELSPLRLMMPQQITKSSAGSKTQYVRTDVTVLNGQYGTYWWRRVSETDKQRQGRNLQLEKITFDSRKVIAPKHFGLFELAGGNALVWDVANAQPMTMVELRWQKDWVRVMPVWRFDLAPGESKTLSFRLIPLKNAVRADTVQEDWLFGYQTSQNMLRIHLMPLTKRDRMIVNMNLNSSSGSMLAGKPSEIPGMTPSCPGRLDYRVSTTFQDGEHYPIKIQLSDLQDNSTIAEVDGLVTP